MKHYTYHYLIPAALLLLASCKGPSDPKTPVAGTMHAAPVKNTLSTKDAVAAAEKKFNAYLPEILKSHDGSLDLMESHTGDFTGDGVDDVAIYFALSPVGGGNALVGQGLTLYQNTGSDVKVIAGFEPDYIFVFDTIADGKINVEKLEYAEGDGHCCPSIRTPHTLTINGNKAE